MKIRFEKISFSYDSKLPHQHPVLKDIDLAISNGEFVGIIGPSGSGKTTLIQHFTGLLRPSSGKIYIDDQDIWRKDYPLSDLRKKIGLVFQFPETQLFEETVLSDVGFGPKALHLPEDEIEIRVDDALKKVGLNSDAIKTRSPHHLSEGEKRRVAIAGVLAMAPEMLVLDEPTACLDPAGVKLVIRMLQELHRSGTTIIVITHNMEVIIPLAQRIVVLHKGEICFDGRRDAIFTDRNLLSQIGFVAPRVLRFCHYLQSKKILTSTNIYSIKDLHQEIKTLKRMSDD